jgi:tetratricopeptide (TPR) repeat protein
MNDNELTDSDFEKLLQRNEGPTLDFKSEMYHFLGKEANQKNKDAIESQFLKDILSLVNTERSETSYIIFGIDDDPETNQKKYLGILPPYIDNAVLTSKIQGKTYTPPEFQFYLKIWKEKTFGVITIPLPKIETPFEAKNDFGEVRRNTIYYRNGSQNREADPQIKMSILNWFSKRYQESLTPKYQPMEITSVPSIALEDVVGREEEIYKIRQSFMKSIKPVVIHGIGGLGKSTLSRAYFQKYKTEYRHIFWLELNASLSSVFFSNITLLDFLEIQIPKTDFQDLIEGRSNLNPNLGQNKTDTNLNQTIDYYEKILQKLKNLPGPNLFILDNADPEIEVEILKLTGDGIHIIISSRGKFSEYTILELLPLSLENAEKMFFRHYPRAKSEPIFLKELLELIDSHTLLIEIFAKVLKESLELNSVRELLEEIKKSHLMSDKIQEGVFTSHSNKEIQVGKYLRQVFDRTLLHQDDYNINVLYYMAFFPSEFIPAQSVIEVLSITGIEKKEIISTLKYLSSKGWLDEEDKKYKIHKIIKEVLLYFGKLDLAFFQEYIDYIQSILNKDRELVNLVFLHVAIHILEYFSCMDTLTDFWRDTTRSINENKISNNSIDVIYKNFPSKMSKDKGLLNYILYSYSQFLCDQFRFEDALRLFSKVIFYNISETAGYFNTRGIVNGRSGKFKEAIIDFSKAIELEPDVSYYMNRAHTYSELKDYLAAIKDYSEDIDQYPNNPFAYYCRGNAYCKIIDYEAAIKDLTEAIHFNPNDPRYFNDRGSTYIQIKNFDAAIQDYTEAIHLNPYESIFFTNRGDAYLESKEYIAAIKDYSEAIKLDQDDASIYNSRGFAYANLEDYTKAISDYTKAINLNPEDSSAYNNRGIAYDNIKAYREAIQDYTKVINLEPEDVVAYYNRGIANRKLKDYSAAVIDYTKVVSIESSQPVYYLKLAQCLFLINRDSEAITAINRVFALNPTEPALLIELWFYTFAHIPEKREEAKQKLQTFLVNYYSQNAKITYRFMDVEYFNNLEKAIRDGHPEKEFLIDFVKQMTEGYHE